MFPEIVSFGPFTIHSYGLVIAIGVFFCLYLMKRAAKKYGFPPIEKVFDIVFVVVFSGFVGARLFYVIQQGSWYKTHPLEIFQIWKGGLVYFGGMVGSFLGLFLYVKSARLSFLETGDFTMPYIPLVHAFGRVGCFLNGCCYGKVCHLPWAVQFPLLPEPVHPTQLYEALFNLSLFGFLAWFYPRRHFPGENMALYLILYSVGRFFLEFLRGDQPSLLFSLSLQQILSLAFILTGFLAYGICRRPR